MITRPYRQTGYVIRRHHWITMPPSNEVLPRAYVVPGLNTDVSITEQEVVEFASKRDYLEGSDLSRHFLRWLFAWPRREYYRRRLKPRYVRVGQSFKSSAWASVLLDSQYKMHISIYIEVDDSNLEA